MIQDAAEGFEPDLSFADVVVPVDARAERGFRIVYVNHEHPVESDGAIDLLQPAFQPSLGANVPAGGEQVRRIDADAHRQIASRRP